MELKIKLFKNNVKAEIQDDLLKVVKYFNEHGINITFEQSDTAVKLPEPNVATQLVLPNDGKYDIIVYLYDRLEQNRPNAIGRAINSSLKTKLIYLPTGKSEDVDGYHWYATAHEIMHCLFYKFNISHLDPMDTYIENTNPYSTTGNFAKAWAILSPYLNKPMYTYFSQKELDQWKLKPELWKILDNARKLSGTPFIITSGLRSISENTRVGGKSNSSHLKGLAVDILCTDNIKRSRILYGLLDCGVPLFIEVARKHIHIDIDSSIHAMGQVMIERNDD